MTRDEYLDVLASEPATAMQVGAIHGEFRRLGYAPRDRDQRLAGSAAMLGLGQLASTRDLTMGEAGRLLRLLMDCPDRAAQQRLAASASRREALRNAAGVLAQIAAAVAAALGWPATP